MRHGKSPRVSHEPLSGGQKQRIILARALYRQPKLLFLDEAISHLDVGNEQLVNAAIRRLDVIRVIVAHRPETIASADRVRREGSCRSCVRRLRGARRWWKPKQ